MEGIHSYTSRFNSQSQCKQLESNAHMKYLIKLVHNILIINNVETTMMHITTALQKQLSFHAL